MTSLGTSASWESSVAIWPDGSMEEVMGTGARRLLAEEPTLARYAYSLLRTDRPEARFYWRTSSGAWLAIRIERRQHAFHRPFVALSLWPEEPAFALTARELDVLTLLAGGLTNREIASRLRTGVRTVSTHVEHILAKLGARTRAAAAAMAAERGLLRLPVPHGGHGMESLAIGMLEVLVASEGPERDGGASRVSRPRRPLLIGSALPLSGPAGADGREMRNGVALAIDEINARGGVAGRRIEHVPINTDIFSETGIREAFSDLQESEVDAITVGYVLTGGETILELAADYGSPLLHAITSEEELRLVRNDPTRFSNVFQVCPSEVHYGGGFTRFLDELVASGRWRPRRRSVAIVETPVLGGKMSTGKTIDALEWSGWSVDAVECVPELGTDWHTVVARLLEIHPAAMLVANYVASELAELQRAISAGGMETLVYAVYTPSIPEFVDLVGTAGEGLVWSTVTGTYSDPLGSRFAGRYVRTFGRPPGRSHAGIAYDEVYLLAQAWAEVGNPRDFHAVSTQLKRGAYRGVNGAYFFGEDQGALSYPDMTLDPSLGQAHLVFQIQDGHHRILSPHPYVEASFRSPSWWPATRAAEPAQGRSRDQ